MDNSQRDKTLILVHSNYPWIKDAEQKGYHVSQTYRNIGLIGRVLRKICMKLNLQVGMERWVNDWYFSIDEYDTVIIFANVLFKPLFYWLKKKKPQIRLICWYWDPFSDCKLRFEPQEGIELWSFDDDDCRNYGLNYSKTFFTPRSKDNSFGETEVKYDAFFVGEDKGRYDKLRKLQEYLADLGLKSKFIIVRDHKIFVENRGHKKRTYSQPISQEKATEYIMQSRILVDLYQRGQTGLSQRAVEALLNEKKLITDNENIRKYDFYREGNIFILHDDNYQEIEVFLQKEFEKIPDKILETYSFDTWFKRFFENKRKERITHTNK